MSNLKQFRNRIKTIKSSEKITRAMQMVSASKLQKIKHQISDSNSYLESLSKIMHEIANSDVLKDLSIKEQHYFKKDSSKTDLLILISSERGLCGSFNSSIIKKIKTDISDYERKGRNFELLLIGKKGYDALHSKYSRNLNSYFSVSKQSNENIFLEIKHKILDLVDNEKVGNCYIYYNRFKNAITQIATKQRILPVEESNKNQQLDNDDPAALNQRPKKLRTSQDSKLNVAGSNDHSLCSEQNFEYEGEELASKLIALYINGVVSYALLQSKASEEGARMTAMDNATKNANEMMNKLTLKLNRSRQTIITKELIEIISGAEAAAN